MEYPLLKSAHILSLVLLFGTGLGSAFYKYYSDRSGNLAAIAVTNRLVVFADWLFTTPTVIIQPVTGFLLLQSLGMSWQEPWVIVSLILYAIAGGCWVPVVWLQIRMRDVPRSRRSLAGVLSSRQTNLVLAGCSGLHLYGVDRLHHDL